MIRNITGALADPLTVMEYIISGPLFILGLLIGSFLNVVILRFDTEESIAKGRSKCPHCGKTLTWRELIPLVSFAVQGGRCVGCNSKISWQYPLVELTTGFILPVIFAKDPRFFLPIAVIMCLYVVIFVYDLRHKIIPDLFSYSAALIALIVMVFAWFSEGTVDPYRTIAGPALFLFFYFFWTVSHGRWMGLGDAKLALSIGWLLGLWQGIAVILLSFWTGALYFLVFMFWERFFLKKKTVGLKSQIPFGPFIIIGFLLSYIFDIDIQSILSFLAV